MEDKRIKKRDISKQKIINKRRKTDDSTNSDVLISMKDARKENERYRLLKPGLKSNYEITDKRQSIVESIFGELKVDEDIIFSEEYSSSDESDESLSRENKNSKLKFSSELQGYKKVHIPGNGNCLFSSLDMIVFDGSFGSYALRQLIADHINDNKDVYIDHIEGDFSKYVEKIRKNGEWGGKVELFAFSNMIDVWIELWCDVKDPAPFYTIGDSINQKVIKLLYTNWSHYSPLVKWINKGTANKNKMKIPKKWKAKKCTIIVFKSNEKPLCESEIRIIISYKTKSDEFPLYLAAKENSKEYFKEKFEYLIRKDNKYPERLKNGLNLSDHKDKITYKNRKRTFLKTIKDNEVNLFKIADLWLDSDESDVKEIQLLQLKTNTVDESKYKETKRLEKESPDTFKPFWLEADSIRDIYKIGSYKIVPRKKWSRYFLKNLIHQSNLI